MRRWSPRATPPSPPCAGRASDDDPALAALAGRRPRRGNRSAGVAWLRARACRSLWHVTTHSSSLGVRRRRFTSDRWRFSSTRLICDPLVGFVGRLVGSTRSPSANLAARRSSASCRFRACERESEAAARTTGPKRSNRRARCRGPRAVEAAMSNWTSTRLSVRLACCPPVRPRWWHAR